MSSTCVFAYKLLTQDEGQSIETEVPEFGVVMASGSNQSAFDRVLQLVDKGYGIYRSRGARPPRSGVSSAVANRDADHMYATFYSS